MFISHTYVSGSAYYSYLLTDSDFQEQFHAYTYAELELNNLTNHARSRLVSGIIKLYERRELPVAANIALVLQYDNNHYGQCDMNKVNAISWVSLCPEYPKYKDDISKYLLLL